MREADWNDHPRVGLSACPTTDLPDDQLEEVKSVRETELARLTHEEEPRSEPLVRGALGTLRASDLPGKPSLRRRLLVLLAIMGPGLIVMVGDNDAGGITTYAQAGQAYGVSLLWLFPVLLVVLYVAQEMVARLGAVTGVGHGRLIRERFGRFWAAFSVFDLFLLNFLTLVTEFIGVDLAMAYFGVSPYISVPIAAVAMVGIVVSGELYRWERYMYVLIGVSLLVFPLMALAPVRFGPVLRDTFVPGVAGGLSSTSMIFIIGIVGTTIAPWQLFFQQGNVIDKRIGTRFTNYERADTFIGAVVTNLTAGAVVIAAAFAFAGTKLAGSTTTDGLGLARGFQHYLGPAAGVIFAIVLAEAALIGAATVTVSTSYALGDLFGLVNSLNTRFKEAKGFYMSYVGLIVLAAGVVLIPRLPLGVVNLAVQVLAGILLPSALGFLVLLCNDRELLGPWVNTPWVNTLATLIVALLLQLSLVLTIVTVFPSANVTVLVVATGIPVLASTVLVATAERVRKGSFRASRETLELRRGWLTPQDALLKRPPMSKGRRVVLGVLRAYLVVAMILTAVSFVRIAH
jgi:NRAMP (natural resistance-associated macrophage protein)-like metal ion transporter